MKRLTPLALAALLVLGSLTRARAAEVRMVGDTLIYGVYFANHNFTGWNAYGSQTEDRFEIYERYRLRASFIANENLKFRLGVRVQTVWGHGTYTAANPSADALQVYQAYLQFKWPDTDVEITAGMQEFSLPANAIFCDSVVWGGTMAAAAIVTAPIIPEKLTLTAGFSRMVDDNQTFDTTTTQVADTMDLSFLSLPVVLNGTKITPWAALSVVGRDLDFQRVYTYGNEGVLDSNMLSPQAASHENYRDAKVWSHGQVPYWWAGGVFELTALDPVKFYADVLYGEGAMADRSSSRRHGWFVDFAAEYAGWALLTPQAFAWWSTGEDGSSRNGSERMPSIVTCWGPGGNFLFDSAQEMTLNSNISANPIGNWGLGVALANVSFLEKLSHRASFIYMRGNNSNRALRRANLAVASGGLGLHDLNYVVMGRDLSVDEYAMGVNVDTTYQLYENLAVLLETGWAHGQYKRSIWAPNAGDRMRNNDAWKITVGFSYKY